MREILFRGKTYDGEWVEGFLFNSQLCRIFWATAFKKEEDNMFYCEGKDVNPETIGQYTSLTDKNGKKIFEGDIVKAITLDTNTEQLAVVGFGKFIDENNDDEYLGFYIEFDGFRTTITQLEMEEVKDRFEVIGNITDSPELLEVQNER